MPTDKVVVQQDIVNLFSPTMEGSLSLCAEGGKPVFTIHGNGEYFVEGIAIGYSPALYAAFKDLLRRTP